MRRQIKRYVCFVTKEFLQRGVTIYLNQPADTAQEIIYIMQPGWLVLNAVIEKVKATDMRKYPPVGDYILYANMIYVGRRKCYDEKIQKAWRKMFKKAATPNRT